jgi:hypothetical protein
LTSPLRYFLFVFIFISSFAFSQEICTNGRDDDNDGKVDLNDSDCQCTGEFILIRDQSIIPNHSFEDKTCCPTSFSQMGCVKNWIQPALGTSDYINRCSNYDIDPGGMDPREPPIPLPLPDGEGATGMIDAILRELPGNGIYKEYIATRLNAPLRKNQTYQLDLYVGFGFDASKTKPFNLTIFGHPELDGLPFMDAGYECPSTADAKWTVIW